MKRYTSAHVIAQNFCMDYSDVQDYRYQYGRTNKPVFAIGDKYYCATKKGGKPAKHIERDFEWTEIKSSFADSIGWIIYEGK